MSWVSDQIFAAGGTTILQDWRQFQLDTGITTVVHLNPDSPDEFVGPEPARFLWLDITHEDDADFEHREQAGRFVLEAVYSGEKVLLHATKGRHRTRWVFVAYLILSGRKPSTALRLAEKLPWLAPYNTDRERWEQFSEYVRRTGPGGLDAV
jgi:hypothetical protein